MSAEANIADITVAAEPVFNADLSGAALRLVRVTSENLSARPKTSPSQEVRSFQGEQPLVGWSTSGAVGVPVVIGDGGPLALAALLAAGWTQGDQDIPVTVAADGTVTATAGTFNEGVVGARYLMVSGMLTPANNGLKRVLSASASVIVLEGVGTAETAAYLNLAYQWARTGTTLTSFYVERHEQHLETPCFVGFHGQVVDEWNFALGASQVARQTFQLIGARSSTSETTRGDGSKVAATEGTSRTTLDVKEVVLDGAAMAAEEAVEFGFSLSNNLRARPYLTSLYTAKHGRGTPSVAVTLGIYFDAKATLDRFLAAGDSHTLLFTLWDGDGHVLSFWFPKLQVVDGSTPGVFQGDGVVGLRMAALDAGDGYCFQVDSLTADPAEFNGAACAVILGTYVAGGDTFDCYTPVADVPTLPYAGTGWGGLWWLANSPWGYVVGDTFDTYTEESPVSQTMDAGSGFDGAWVVGNIS